MITKYVFGRQKFKTSLDIESLKKSVASDSAWKREYLLKIIPEDDAVYLATGLNTTTTYLKTEV